MVDCDVLIVGAGPVGTALALELAHQDISFRIVDKAATRSGQSRAFGVQPRTLELFNRLVDAKWFLSHGQPLNAFSMISSKKLVAGLEVDDFGTKDTQFPLPILISQADTEQYLDDGLSRYGKSVERPVSVAAENISQDGDGVRTILKHPDGKCETVISKYIVGCDGAHSAVRHAASNIQFEGAPYPMDFLLCDAHLEGSNLPRNGPAVCVGSGTLGLFPLPGGLTRIVAAGQAGQMVTGDEPTTEHFQKLLETFAPPGHGTITDAVWLSRFRLHHRIASSYRDGRIFLAGDAAHLHSPAGGQGLNAGVQDSINLGWKLGTVLRGKATDAEALLNSYDAERRRVGQYILGTTDRMFNFAATSNWLFIRLRQFLLPWVLPQIAQREFLRRGIFRFMSQFGVKYRKSAIVGTATGFTGPVMGGDRPPDCALKVVGSGTEARLQGICSGKRHTLLVFGGSSQETMGTSDELQAAELRASGALNDGESVQFILTNAMDVAPGRSYLDPDGKAHALYGFAESSYVLVRPDGYIGFLGPLSSLDELLEFLS